MKYQYTGVESDGDVYFSETAPSQCGVYTVIAAFANYDDAGRVIKRTYADGSFETIAYDILNRTVTATNSDGLKTKYIYNEFGDNVDIKKLSLEEKIGQRFMFGVNSYNIDIIIELIKNYSIGGVILYKKNYNSYSEMLSVVKRLKDANKNNKIPLFISIDQEGGRVNRFPSEFVNLKNVYDVSKKDEKL